MGFDPKPQMINMSDQPLSPAEARNELFELSTSVRALLDWYDMTGVTGVPRGVLEHEPAHTPMTPPSLGAPAQVSRDAPAAAPARAVANSFEQQAPREAPEQRSAVASFEQQ